MQAGHTIQALNFLLSWTPKLSAVSAIHSLLVFEAPFITFNLQTTLKRPVVCP